MIVRMESTVFNGAYCEEGVEMDEAQADAHLVKNSHTYIGYATLRARPGVVFYARVGACLFAKSQGCTAHVLKNEDAEPPDVAQPALASARTVYVRPGQASFLPTFQLFHNDTSNRPTTSASECVEGGLGSCWLMAAIASVAQHPGEIPNLFKKKPDGYEVELYDSEARQWSTCTVDDALPGCRSGSEFTPAYAQPGTADAPSIWPCLLEKAFAVALGNSYLKLNGGSPGKALNMLTGEPAFDINPTELSPDALHAKVSDCLRTNYAIIAATGWFDRTTGADIVFKGQIAQIHAYSILGSRTAKDGTPEFQLRNPWGRIGLLKPGAALQDQTDGTFWISASALAEQFQIITVAKVTSASTQ